MDYQMNKYRLVGIKGKYFIQKQNDYMGYKYWISKIEFDTLEDALEKARNLRESIKVYMEWESEN